MRVNGGAELPAGSFEVSEMAPEAFVESARKALTTMGLPVRVGVALEGDVMVVTVERVGRSVLRYDLVRHETGFTARLRSRRIAPLHLPFSEDFLDTVTRVLRRVAADSASGGDALHS